MFAVSPSGVEQWSDYGDSDHDSFESVLTCGSRTVAAGTKRGDCDPSRAWVLVLDEDGERVRDRAYVIGSNQNLGTAPVSSGDGYLLAGGVLDREGRYGEVPWLARLDADGDVEWTRLLAVRDGRPELLTGRPAAHVRPESDPEITRLVETGGGVALVLTAGDRSWLGVLQ